MKQQKEIPGKVKDFSGMRKYTGYLTSEYRYHVYVPTTIFDPQSAIIRAYKPKNVAKDAGKQFTHTPELIVEEEWVKLALLPRWNVEYQCLELSRADQRKVNKALNNLEKKLERNK